MPLSMIPNSPTMKRKIVVIGAGISGMGAAHMLAPHHDVTLIEAGQRIGGHARTAVAGKNGDQPVDTGFIVFNYANYPHLAALFEQLDVPVVKSNMSFGASIDGGRFEYALTSIDAFFAQRKNAVNPKMIRMAADLSGAIWSTPVEKIMDFPAYAMIDFFENHALLGYSGQHQWYTVEGGSRQYVNRLEAAMRTAGVEIRVNAPVQAVRRTALGAEVKLKGAGWEAFDEVIFATHSDDTLAMLSDPTEQERTGLGAIKYQPNDVVLHCDESIMPKRRKTWASWVYTEDAGAQTDRIDLTYWMNSLQPIPKDDPHFVTLNTKREIRQELIYDQVTLRHPVYDLAALAAQKKIAAFNGAQNTWFCGAWMKHGFHEDGLSSAVDVVDALNQTAVLPLAAE